MNVILPSSWPELSGWIDDILGTVDKIHDFDDEDVCLLYKASLRIGSFGCE